MCDKNAVWDVEIQRNGAHVPICGTHKKDAAIDLSRKGDLVLRPVKSTPAPLCAYVAEQEVPAYA